MIARCFSSCFFSHAAAAFSNRSLSALIKSNRFPTFPRASTKSCFTNTGPMSLYTFASSSKSSSSYARERRARQSPVNASANDTPHLQHHLILTQLLLRLLLRDRIRAQLCVRAFAHASPRQSTHAYTSSSSPSSTRALLTPYVVVVVVVVHRRRPSSRAHLPRSSRTRENSRVTLFASR